MVYNNIIIMGYSNKIKTVYNPINHSHKCRDHVHNNGLKKVKVFTFSLSLFVYIKSDETTT